MPIRHIGICSNQPPCLSSRSIVKNNGVVLSSRPIYAPRSWPAKPTPATPINGRRFQTHRHSGIGGSLVWTGQSKRLYRKGMASGKASPRHLHTLAKLVITDDIKMCTLDLAIPNSHEKRIVQFSRV